MNHLGEAVSAPALGGMRLHRYADLLAIESDAALTIASTAVLGGGVRRGRCIVSVQVPRSYSGLDPPSEIRHRARRHGFEPDVGLMTAVPLERARVSRKRIDGVTACVTVTAGITHAWSAGSPAAAYASAGTINIIALLNRALEPGAAINLITAITEAKVLTLLEAGVRTAAGEPASGTVTDAVVVACPDGDGCLQFAGPATPPGAAAAGATRHALREALHG